jgi:hypothetical protein
MGEESPRSIAGTNSSVKIQVSPNLPDADLARDQTVFPAELTLRVLGEIFPLIFRCPDPPYPPPYYSTELLNGHILYCLVTRGQKLEGGVYRINI